VVKHVLHFKKQNPEFIGDAEQYLSRLDETYRGIVAEVTTRNAGTEKSRQLLAYFFERPEAKPGR
jgi:hypothetical protein